MLFGPPGVGKTYTIGELLPAHAVRVELGLGDVVDDLVVGVASRLPGTEEALEALRSEDVPGALAALEKPLNGFPLVIDRAERLTIALRGSEIEPRDTLARDRTQHVMDWIGERVPHHPIVVVSRGWRLPPKEWQRSELPPIPYRAQVSELAIIAPQILERGDELAEALDHNPAALRLVSLSLRLLGGASTHASRAALAALFDDVCALPQGGALAWMARQWLPDILGSSIGATLAIAARMPGAPMEVLKAAIEAVDVPAQTIDMLVQAGVIEARKDGLWVLRAIEDEKAAYPLAEKDAERALRAAAQGYLARVPSRARPTPSAARFLLEAHRLFLEIGDQEEARRTAAFHVGGLIELARRLSVEKKAPREAAAIYADIDRMLRERVTPETSAQIGAPAVQGGRDMRRLRSYVVHYKHYNRHLGALEALGDVLHGFREARELWPDNALWYAHEISLLFEQGRSMDALRTREEAYAQVKEHPRRDALLTGRPAEAAWRAHQPVLSLELLLKLGLASRDDLALETAWSRVLEGWERGVDLVELPGHGQTRVVFSVPPRATLKEAGDEWFFEISAPLDVFARAASPEEAVHKAGDALAAEVLRLVQAYADELTRDELERKVLLLRYVDLLAGDIGLAFPKERWLLGRIEGPRFIPVQHDFAPLDLPATFRLPSEPDKLWFAKVATRRDGYPTGEIVACELASGSGVVAR